MRVLHIVPSFYPAVYYGGPIYSLYSLCNVLARQGVELRVLTTDTAGPGKVVVEDFPTVAASGYRVYFCRRRFGVSVSTGVLCSVVGLIRWADVVHLTAVYSFPTIPGLLTCRVLGKPVVWSPRGALQRWEGSRRRMLKAVWEWVCRLVAPGGLVLHVTSEKEAKESLERFPGVKVAVIPNGVEIPDQVGHVNSNGTLRLLYLGRLDPKKGIENLLAACRILDGTLGVPWSLGVVGTGDPNYAKAIEIRIKELGLSQPVHLVGEVLGEAKQRLFEKADLVVVPSYTENFSMVVAEALAHGVPVIASRGTPWQRVEEMGCGLWVDNAPEELAKAIDQMSRMPLREMGQRGRKWMRREFGWDIRAKEMITCYEAAMTGRAGSRL